MSLDIADCSQQLFNILFSSDLVFKSAGCVLMQEKSIQALGELEQWVVMMDSDKRTFNELTSELLEWIAIKLSHLVYFVIRYQVVEVQALQILSILKQQVYGKICDKLAEFCDECSIVMAHSTEALNEDDSCVDEEDDKENTHSNYAM